MDIHNYKGRLEAYDGSFFHLKSHCFSTRLMDSFDYSSESIFSGDAAVPADSIAFSKSYELCSRMLDTIPKESFDNGMFMMHPVLVILAGISYKIKLDNLGGKILKHISETKTSVRKNLENRLKN